MTNVKRASQAPPASSFRLRLRLVVWSALAVLVPLSSACDWLTGRGEPETARVIISSTDTQGISTVTSLSFILVPDPECPTCDPTVSFIEADTTTIQLPFEETYRLNSRLQFYVEAVPPDGVTSTLTMQVFIDDEEWYNDFRTLEPAGENGERETLQFVYEFNNRSL